jgi:tetratricopeptide (TPR) repeat protein
VPDDPVACVGLVEVELELGDTEGAWRRALALLEKSPDQPQRLLLAGRVALRAGRKAEARQFLERARELQPDKVTVLRELARLNFETLRYREAAELFERVGAADPQDGVSWFNAAVSWLKQDPPNIERAARCYRKAVELGEPRDERLEQRYGIQP